VIEISEQDIFQDANLAQFYDQENRWGVDFDYCTALAKDAGSVLDLGCGTGELAAALAVGRNVTGVDPAAAMLEIARNRPGGDAVEWVEADALSLRLGRGFDLVLLTGHAFQVFLTEEDQARALLTIAAHLKPGGRFIFDTRNPSQQAWEKWNYKSAPRTIHHAEFGVIEAWSISERDNETGVVTYEKSYRIKETGKTYSASARIQFPSKEGLAGLMSGAGLSVDQWLGDWRGSAFHADADEIIPLGRRLRAG